MATEPKRTEGHRGKKTAGGGDIAPRARREPNEREKSAISAAREARKRRPARLEYVEEPSGEDGALALAPPHNDSEGHPVQVAETFATTSNDFVGSSMLHLANVTMRGGKPSVEGLNASLALIGAIAPENELEAALAVQMAATHELSMEMLRRTKTADTREAMRDYTNLATKLTRTFTAQMKQLSDWRRGGEQVVRHVHVYEGGRAVVAETINVGDRNAEKISQVHAFGPALLGANPQGNDMPIPGSEGEEALQDARRCRGKRSAER